MPTLAVGTTNPGKVAAVQSALAGYPALAHFTVAPSKVDSGVSEQPGTLEETTRGAKNRAKGDPVPVLWSHQLPPLYRIVRAPSF